jgi:bla regulator protein blaR1
MNTFLNLIPTEHVSTLGWTLLHALWQGTLLCLLAALGFYLLRHHSARSRYIAGVSLLGTQLLASLATYVYYLPAAAAPSVASPSGAMAPVAAFTPYGVPATLPLLLRAQLWITAHLSELVVCWLIGVGLLLLRFAGGWLYLERLRYTSRPVTDRTWTTRFGVLVARLDVSQSVEFRETARIMTPMVVGVLRPVVLVPLGLMAGLSPAEAEAILAHELAHIRRYDYLVNLLQSLVEVVYFFHPGLWWLSDKIRAEREHCCDDLAMAVCGDRVSLAHALVRVAEFRQESSLVVAFAADKPLLLQRIRRVLGVSEKPRRHRFGYVPSAALLLSLLVGASVYAYQKEESSEKKEDKPIHHSERLAVKNTLTGVPAPIVTLAPDASIDTIIISLTDTITRPSTETLAERTRYFDHVMVMEGDSFRKKTMDVVMAEHHEKMRALQQQMKPYQEEIQALQKQMEPLHKKMANLHLEMEKQRFEVERVQREQEKVEWKKEQAMEARQKLVEKRSAVMYPKSGQAKLSEAELEKQLATYENQIKAKEQEITALNEQIAQSRKQMEEVEKPMNTLETEMEKVSREMETYSEKIEAVGEKMEVIGEKMELEAQKMGAYMPHPPAPYRPAKSPRLQGKVAPAPAASYSPKAAPALQGTAAPYPPKAALAPAMKGKAAPPAKTTLTPAPPRKK